MKYLIILLCVLLSHNIDAADRIAISISSYHTTTEFEPINKPYNNHNFGMSLEKDIGSYYIGIGFYENSLYKQSTHISVIKYKVINNVEYGVNAGVVTGYNSPTIFMRPYIIINNVRIGYIPKTPLSDEVITLEYIINI